MFHAPNLCKHPGISGKWGSLGDDGPMAFCLAIRQRLSDRRHIICL
ncbi:hypothetical protein EDWATA_00947 [Edwardsiella tarda ATCC 23685]|uniref:Uncharacterized protein n=1 Tax=Edwardsiella tarda ATCC 23685 TaxID=500638 RepID=D4F2J8_EDWTA|nr:hypothetical protein EDWATA_00947 [Edwardsiella tarda ATCC 23685]